MIPSSTSSRSRKTESSQSKIERINLEAKEVLTQKEREIKKFEEAINEAEQSLAKLQAELKQKQEVYDSVNAQDEKSEDSLEEIDLSSLKATQDAEIQQIKARHDEEIQRLQSGYSAALREAEEWADAHAQTVFVEKKAQLEDLRRELDGLKAAATESEFATTQSRTRLFQESKSLSLQNAQRIQELDAQLSELSAVTREELRDVRAKIDECFVAVNVREREHTSEIERYKREIKQREEKYNSHLTLLNEQFDHEKQRLEYQLKSLTTKKSNIERVLGQIEKNHESQVQTTLKDIERMKSTIYQSQTRDDRSLTDTKSYAGQVQAMQRECRHTEQEIALVNNEIKDLTEENKQLQLELNRLDSTLTTRVSRATVL